MRAGRLSRPAYRSRPGCPPGGRSGARNDGRLPVHGGVPTFGSGAAPFLFSERMDR